MADEIEVFRAWFRTWGVCVATVDFDAAKSLFADDVVGFGTHVAFVSGLDALKEEQWSKVWPKITDFEFLVDELVGATQGEAAWAAVPWASTGYDEAGRAFDRPGRATVTYRREGDVWLGTHTHFSLQPGVQPHTYGPRGRQRV